MRVSSLGEWGAIRRIADIARRPGQRAVPVGIGDDAAALRPKAGMDALAAADMLIEGVHFDLGLTGYRELGYKALAVNVSDIAAMGGRPGHYLVSLAMGPETRVEDLEALAKGMEDAGEAFGVKLIGGDTCSSPGPLVISITILGTVNKGMVVLRSGARPGDDVYVTGTLGDSAAGLKILKAGGGRKRAGKKGRGTSDSSAYLISRHLTPTPRARAGRLLGEGALASSMIDISDGFSSDLAHILDESGVGAVVDAEAVPLSRELVEFAGEKEALRLALHGGEDYELIFTADPRVRDKVAALERKTGTVFTMVGSVTRKRGALIESPGGLRRGLRPKGYEHFRK